MIVDTGASKTSSPDPDIASLMHDRRFRPGVSVVSSNGGLTEVPVAGTVPLTFAGSRVSPHARVYPIPIMHVPGSVAPLLGVADTLDSIDRNSAVRGACALFERKGMKFFNGSGEVVGRAGREKNLYVMDAFPVRSLRKKISRVIHTHARPSRASQFSTLAYGCLRTAKTPASHVQSAQSGSLVLAAAHAELMVAHQTLGHAPLRAMQDMSSSGQLGTMLSSTARRLLSRLSRLPCVACAQAKFTKSSNPQRADERVLGHNQRDGARIASDVAGPFQESRYKKYRYFVVFVHKRTRYAWVGFLRNRSDIFDEVRRQKRLWDASLNEDLVFFISDNAKEYTSEALRDWFLVERVQQRFSCPDSSAQNGVAERYIRTLRERAHAMLSHCHAPFNLWAEAIRHANDLLNHTPRKTVGGLTPYQFLTGAVRDVFPQRCVPFGSLILSLLPNRIKFRDKARECIFLGLSAEHKDGVRLLHLSTNEVIISRSVRKFVDVFPYAPASQQFALPSPTPMAPPAGEVSVRVASKPAPARASVSKPPARKSNRVTARPFVYDGAAYKEAKRVDALRPPHEERDDSDSALFSRALWGSGDAIAQFAQRVVDEVPEPRSFLKARKGPDWDPCWKPAVQEELAAHYKNETWFRAPILRSSLPPGSRPIKTKWVFKVKTNNLSGQAVRYKGRLVARGDTQSEDSYSETFAPTARWSTVRAFAALANQHEMEMRQLDVVSAFLQPELPSNERVFIEVPDGVEGIPPSCVLELKKTLYGLKQSAKRWHDLLHARLTSLGFVPSFADPCLYIRKRGDSVAMVLTYVDDCLVAGSAKVVAQITADLSAQFAMTDGGEPKTFLGVHFRRDRVARTVTLSQDDYARRVLKRFGMERSVPSDTPAGCERLSKTMGPQNEEERARMRRYPYRAAVGSLLYLSTATRPDLAQAVSQVARFSADPGQKHWDAVLRIFRYLAGTVTRGITYRSFPHFSLFGYADADDAGDPDTRKSTSGFLFMFCGAPISWKSKMMKLRTTLSSCESELVALSMAAREAVWFRNLFSELYDRSLPPTTIYEDNDGARSLANSPRFSERSKHIDRKYFFVQERVQEGHLVVKRCDTRKMLADIFTKPLPRELFGGLVQKIQSGRVRPIDPDFVEVSSKQKRGSEHALNTLELYASDSF
jgi:hypothetical protein